MVRRYKKFGSEGLLRQRGSYNGAYKVSVIKYMHDNHLLLLQTADNFRVPTDVTVGKWERTYYEERPTGLYRDNRGRKSKNEFRYAKKKKKLNKETKADLIAKVQCLRIANE